MDMTRGGMNTWASMPTGSDLEASSLHVPVGASGSLPERANQGRIERLKSGALTRLHGVKRSIDNTAASLHSTARQRTERTKVATVTQLDRMRRRSSAQVERVQASMRSNPMKWIGIASGAGLALGLMGRFADARRKRYPQPDLVIIETR